MSIQWTLVAGVLYFEIILVAVLLLPFLKPRTWQKFFKSRFLLSLESQANLYYMVFVVILVLLFMDSIREMNKYAGELNIDHSGSRHVDAELQHSMKLFRAQRNFYIAGFALFLLLVIRKLVTLITALAQLDIQAEAAMKQAKGASEAAKTLMKGDGKSGDKSASGDSKEIENLRSKLKEKEDELAKAKSSEKAMKSQSDNLTKEYDRLMKEHQELVKKSTKVETEKKKDL